MNEDKLIKRCQRYDMSAYKVIYQHYEQPLLRTALRILGQRQDAEDAVQTTFLKLYRGIKNFQFKSKFSTYLFRILINNCFDILKGRKQVKLDTLDKVNPSYTPEPGVKFQLEKAIDALPQRMRACFVLFAIEEFKQNEIAEILGLSLGAVKSNIFHAKTRLRTRLSDVLTRENS
ncbi:MAG: RNA polymerase sigma factor [Candidatus Aminicenantes bacterium]|nr:MAG: RNA polymerase sigma factor [Candidatus Aminicenantes bacterium]